MSNKEIAKDRKPPPLIFGWKKLVILLGIFWLWASPVHGYVLKGPHILDLMVRKLSGAQTLQVNQLVVVVDSAVSDQPIELKETLRFVFPDRFRSEIEHGNSIRIHLFSQGEALTIVDGTITGNLEGRFDRYKDLLLYNSRKLLHKALYTHGVDVGTTSLGLMDDRIVYVIGAAYPDTSVSQIWVDKERFLPLRWINVFKPEDGSDQSERLEFIYRNWQKLDEVWYPMAIETYQNEFLIKRTIVTKAKANVVVDGELMSIPHLLTLYPKADTDPPPGQEPPSGVDEVQRTIEDFQKKFEP